ncbi:DUF6468 domain-containing protein [Maritalea porphyrae]|jgi:hypothetical protein|uniref:DUF6468 domain-containing protein n=1 Tax=Maritalea porphyrae TaxID=880732 RepID=UPI0022AFFD2A|nr:DUF6468 domain-containing protein [Maritalea porphyrae]MCZ4272709.1 DUF6468 domain-containing protein [Maritalea porphyrae]
MGNFALGLIVEGAVAVLLILTIGYCYILNIRLKRLRDDRAALQTMITDLVRATDQANGAITELRKTAIQCDGMIQTRLSEAESFSIELAHHVNAGQSVMHKIAMIAQTARNAAPQPKEKPLKAKAALDHLDSISRRDGAAA